MNASTTRPGKPGFATYLLVLSTGAVLTLLMVYTYRKAMATHEVQAQVQLRTDYGEKEDAILRSIVAIAPNRAMLAMSDQSNSASPLPLRWQDIFSASLNLANARTSVDATVLNGLNLQNAVKANSGDSALAVYGRVFYPILTDSSSYKSGYISAGINRSLGAGFPAPLGTTITNDAVYPIIADDKMYNLDDASTTTFLSSSTLNGDGTTGYGILNHVYPATDKRRRFNRLRYPDINFGYATPGTPFVAKRNWWAFTLDLASHDNATADAARTQREFVFSIYEIPSQLAISASSFMSLGQFASGDSWENVTIAGGVFAGKAVVEGNTNSPIAALASRRSMTLSSNAVIGEANKTFDLGDPFKAGERENYQVTNGAFFPVSLASESGRVAFIPINRGAAFFDRFAHSSESNTVSPTTWNNYSIGALQCAMRLDITEVESETNKTPTKLRFSYLKDGVRQNLNVHLTTGPSTGLSPGYLFACNEDQTYDFGNAVVDLAYGANGKFFFQEGVTGTVTFDNARFGDPNVGVYKVGYFRPSYPFEMKQLPSGETCVAVYPQRFAAFLASLNADDTKVNNSLAVNVDYTTATGSVWLTPPSIPCTDLDYGLILQECADLTSFSTGFSLVTNLRTYIGDDFNIVAATRPQGYTSAGDYFPPCSLFTPEKRFGVETDALAIKLAGQVGSLADENAENPIRPLDSKNLSGEDMGANRITVNLRPITHPAELPPITMMNWLVVMEELH